MSQSTKRCLRPECVGRVYARGLCHVDYMVARRMIGRGETTWEALVAAGKATRTTSNVRHTDVEAWLKTSRPVEGLDE